MEDRTISLNAVLEICGCSEVNFWSGEIKAIIKNMPSIIPQPKTGHWIDDDTLCHSWRCNQCYWLMRSNRTNFCPNCGADMRGDENG